MSDRGEPTTYEITWMSGHVERIKAHQVSWPDTMRLWQTESEHPARVLFHAEIDGHWTLQLSALVDDIRLIRNAATEEVALP